MKVAVEPLGLDPSGGESLARSLDLLGHLAEVSAALGEATGHAGECRAGGLHLDGGSLDRLVVFRDPRASILDEALRSFELPVHVLGRGRQTASFATSRLEAGIDLAELHPGGR